MARKQRRRCWRRWRWCRLRFLTILIPKYLLLYHSSHTITIDKGDNSTNFSLRWHLRASFVIVLTQMHRYSIKSFLLRVYFESASERDKAVTAASLEDQPCQIQELIVDNNTTSAVNITTTQRGFNSHIGYAKTINSKR